MEVKQLYCIASAWCTPALDICNFCHLPQRPKPKPNVLRIRIPVPKCYGCLVKAESEVFHRGVDSCLDRCVICKDHISMWVISDLCSSCRYRQN